MTEPSTKEKRDPASDGKTKRKSDRFKGRVSIDPDGADFQPAATGTKLEPSKAPAVSFQPPATNEPVITGVVVERPELPEPHEPLSDGDLTDREREELTVCEEAIGAAEKSFITRGRALHVIRDGRHYRKTHGTFDEYLETWDMTRQDASRDILTYRLGERLSQICDKINRDQMLKLVPIADQHGDDAAELVYRTVMDARGGKASAAAIKGAAEVVPEQWDAETAVTRVRAFLAGEAKPAIPAPAPVDPGGQVEKFWATIRRIKVDRLRAADPSVRKELAMELRALADQLAAE